MPMKNLLIFLFFITNMAFSQDLIFNGNVHGIVQPGDNRIELKHTELIFESYDNDSNIEFSGINVFGYNAYTNVNFTAGQLHYAELNIDSLAGIKMVVDYGKLEFDSKAANLIWVVKKLPTSCSTLPSGAIYNDNGFLRICP
jgi:hypothetical protein